MTFQNFKKKDKKIKKIDPNTKQWEKLANQLARACTTIIACKHCGYPVYEGYCCTTCGSSSPR